MKTLVNKLFDNRRSNTAAVPLASMRSYPWVVISLCAFFLFYKYLLQVSPSVMTTELMADFGLTGVGLGNLAATFFYAYLVTQLFVGPMLDKFSPRALTACSIAICAVGALVFSYSNTLTDVLLSRALVGVGVAFATVSYMKFAAIWFRPSQFAFVGGLLASAAMIGSLAAQVPLSFLVSGFGWRSSLFYCGLFGFLLAFLFYVFVRDENPKQMTKAGEKSDALKLRDFAEILKLKYNWYLMFYSGLAFSPVAVFGGLWGNPFLQEAYGLSREGSASLISTIFLGLAIGSPLLGLLSDRLSKRFEVMMVGLVVSLVMLCFAIYCPMPPMLLAVCLFTFGFGTGAFMLAFALGRDLNKIVLAASVVGLINTGDALVGACTEPLVGKVLDSLWAGEIVNGAHYFSVSSYQLALGVLPLYLFAAVFFLFALKKYCK